jgi:hypothetical protein
MYLEGTLLYIYGYPFFIKEEGSYAYLFKSPKEIMPHYYLNLRSLSL